MDKIKDILFWLTNVDKDSIWIKIRLMLIIDLKRYLKWISKKLTLRVN